MNKKPKISIYINALKPYYYPGEKFFATILLDVLDKVNCNKMVIIAKGKQIIKASQRNKFENEEQNQQKYDSSSSSGDSSDDDDGPNMKDELPENPIVKINESKNIFKVKKEIIISENKYINPGKQSFPFELQLPEDIPGTFLFLEKNVYVEIAYSVKVKIEEENLKTIIPIVIRQNEDVFKYKNSNSFNRKIHGCCCIVGETTIKISSSEKFTKAGEAIKLAVNINNQTNTTSTPITLEVYRKLLIKSGNKKIKVTKIVGSYQGKRIINAREEYNKKIHVSINTDNYLSEHLKETKAVKIFKHKEIIPYLFQSIITDSILCEFEIYAESQYANLTNDDLGVFLSVLIYPIEDGIVSKKVQEFAKTFANGKLNKKFFLKGENLLKKEILKEHQKEPEKKIKTKKKIYEESLGDNETIKYENKFSQKKKKNKNSENSENSSEEEDEKDDDYNNNNKNNIKKSIENNNGPHINNMSMDDNNNIMNSNIINNNNEFNNFNSNFNISNNFNYNNNNNNNKIKDSKNLNSEEISFGTSSKDKVNYFNNNIINNDTASNIKKNFSQGFLNDPLDEQLSDDEK